MKVWRLGAALLLAAMAIGCGKNSTPVGVTVTAAGVIAGTPVTVIVNGFEQFAATVTGSSASTVSWQICLPAATLTTHPTTCTPPQGPGQCTLPTVSTPLTTNGTITSTGLYTAPSAIPPQNNFVVVATSCINPAFGIATVQIDSGIRVQISPASASMNLQEHFQFTATVTGTTNPAVTWLVNDVAGGNATVGFICPNPNAPVQDCGPGAGSPGEYFAPGISPGTVTIKAQSAADPSQIATAGVSFGGGDPTLTSLDPPVAAEGSVQQDVYLTGTNFLSTSTVLVGSCPPTTPVPTPCVPTTLISPTLMRVTIPASLLAVSGQVPVKVQRQPQPPTTGLSGTVNLSVVPVRPALIASSPDSVSQTGGSASVLLTGGFFVNGKTTATFNGNGSGANVTTIVRSSRQLEVGIPGIPAVGLNTPGQYPIVVQNSDALAAGVPSMTAVNLTVTPNSIPGAPVATVSVGSTPSAVAIDYADGLAVVTNTGDGISNGSVTIIDLKTNPPSVDSTITTGIGKGPVGVAVDDLLSRPLALVVNSTAKTVSTIDLTTKTVGATLSVAIGPASSSPVPFSIGINPLTHRAVVAYQSTNQATILDLSTGTPTVVQQIGGSLTPFSTGVSPAVAIDPRVNWAVITPGGAGTINLVDLGRAASSGDVGRAPQVIGSLSISTSVRGVGINSETHQVLLTDPQAGSLTEYSLLDNAVRTISFPVPQLRYVAAAADPLENVGIAVSESGTAVVVDLENGIKLQTVSGLGSLPEAVAVDPGSHIAVMANQADGTVSIVSLGQAPFKTLQIVESSPATASTSNAPLPLTITGSGFVGGSQVLLDGGPIPIVSVPANGRQIVATVPASMLGSARRYIVQVTNPGGSVSNVTDLAVIQPVPVGNSPVGVAVDTDRDLAVVTNSVDGTVSLVSLAPPSAGIAGSAILVGANPEGVAVLPRLGLAVVANHGSNNISVVNVTTATPQTVSMCSFCTGPTGVAINQDTASAAVTSASSASSIQGFVNIFGVQGTTPGAAVNFTVDQNPIAMAIDPALNLAGVATASQASAVDFVNTTTGAIAGRASGLQLPTGIVFDPVNQVFLATDSLQNNIIIVDPRTFIQTPVRAGINPTSIDYNFQTSTLVTVNSAIHTMSILDYVCPPSGALPACSGPRVRTVLGLGGSQPSSSVVIGPNAVAIDPKLNLAVLVDGANNRVLLVPLPH